MSDSRSPYWWMIFGACSFAIMGLCTHALKDQCDWQLIAIVRCTLAVLIAGSLTVSAGVPLVFLRPRALWMRSLAGSTSLVCCFYALTKLPVADALTLTHIYPIWVALLSWPMLGERPRASLWYAVFCGCIGVALIQQPHFQERNFACVVALLASFSTAVAMLGLNRLGRIDPRAVVAHFSAVSLVFAVCSYFVFPTRHSLSESLHLTTFTLLLGVGISATIGQIFLTMAFAAGSAGPVSVVGLSQVPIAMLLEAIFFQRAISVSTVIGILFVLFPTAWLLATRVRKVATVTTIGPEVTDFDGEDVLEEVGLQQNNPRPMAGRGSQLSESNSH